MTSVSNINPGGSYDIIQTVFKLSMISNLVNGITGESASQLQAQLASDIGNEMKSAAPQIGSWTIAWGPVVFEYDNSQTSDNAMYAAYNATANCYVVAVAATNMSSKYDKDHLDLNVKPQNMVQFPMGIVPQNSTNPATQNVGNVSGGAAAGITNLLNMQDPTTNESLQAFLNKSAQSSATLIFTGHSLGGSLSPTLAAWLYPNVPAGWSAIYVVPTAGPSTGDGGFCSNFAEVFQPYTIDGVNPAYGVFNQILWNQWDCVPHAWTNIMNVNPTNPTNDILWNPTFNRLKECTSCQSIYGPLTSVNNTARDVYRDINYLYNLAPFGTYTKLDNFMFTSGTQPTGIVTTQMFIAAVQYEHVTAYGAFFGVPIGSSEAKIGVSIMAALSEPQA